MKRLFLITGIFIFLFANTFAIGANSGIKKVVIDPGHGGKDSGAPGKFSVEKDIVLKIALKLGQYINDSFPDVEVIYTRKTDVFIPLHKRAKIANDNDADLFISIHINANTSPKPYGAETYVMGLHKTQDNLAVAKKENAAILLEDNYEEQYSGYDPNSPEANIIFSLYQNLYLDQSLELASSVQNYFAGDVGFKDRGVKQAGFLVLWKTAMPGILVEAGFISNAKDEKFLNKEGTPAKIAYSIFQAFKSYKYNVEGIEEIKNDNKKPKDISDSNDSLVKIEKDDSQTGNTVEPENSGEVFFAVQISTATKEKPLGSPDFKGFSPVHFYMHNGIYKYYIGKEKSLEDAAVLQRKAHKAGIKDAFVIAFEGNNRISTKMALDLLKNQ